MKLSGLVKAFVVGSWESTSRISQKKAKLCASGFFGIASTSFIC